MQRFEPADGDTFGPSTTAAAAIAWGGTTTRRPGRRPGTGRRGSRASAAMPADGAIANVLAPAPPVRRIAPSSAASSSTEAPFTSARRAGPLIERRSRASARWRRNSPTSRNGGGGSAAGARMIPTTSDGRARIEARTRRRGSPGGSLRRDAPQGRGPACCLACRPGRRLARPKAKQASRGARVARSAGTPSARHRSPSWRSATLRRGGRPRCAGRSSGQRPSPRR